MCTKLTLQDVIREIELANQKRDLGHELTPANKDFFSCRDGTFEAVLTGNGDEKCLIPEVGTIHYLYRGQNQEFAPCVPTIYRGHMSDLDIFVERMRLMVFQQLLDSHPIVQYFFKKHNFLVDYEGLAQHYGLKTEVLDLTSKLDVAIFFAVCKYDKDTDQYCYFDDDKIHTAILYVFDPIRDNEPVPSLYFENYMQGNIKPIGLQAFQRPGSQYGYALHISQGKSVKCWMYEFTFTSEDSKHYYNLYQQGELLWIKDILIKKVKAISSLRNFTYRVFGETYRNYKPLRYSRNSLIREFNNMGITFSAALSSDIIFSEDERKDIIDEWNSVIGPNLAMKIVRKYWFEYESVDESGHIHGIKNRCEYRTLKSISMIKMQEFIADFNGPQKAVWRNYTGLPRPKEAKRPDNGQLHKIDGRFVLEIGKPFLTEDDWRIKSL